MRQAWFVARHYILAWTAPLWFPLMRADDIKYNERVMAVFFVGLGVLIVGVVALVVAAIAG